MKIQVVDYDPRWADRFLAEKAAIAATLGEIAVAIHHIGSTSVPGLAAKPILDICVEVSALSALDARDPAMRGLGYENRGENGMARRRFFIKGETKRTHHIHAFAAGDSHVHRHIAFRDYLVAHPEIAGEYADLKRQLANRFAEDREAYMDGKDGFIKTHERRAIAWAGG